MFSRLRQFAKSGYDRDRVHSFLGFTWERFLEDRCMQTAGALSYTSIFALVPLTAAVLGILAAFPGFAGWRDQLTAWVFDNFVPAAGSTVQGYITQFAANASKATAIGVLVLLASSISLMMSIEDTFNRIWRVQIARNTSARFIVYWTALTLGPLLLVAALAISSYALALPIIGGVAEQFSLKAKVLAVLPFLLVWAGLIAGYVVIPNRAVRVLHAVIGACIAAILFEAAKRGFALYATTYASYQQVYGALAMVPIFIFWIYLSWVIVLFGASITSSLNAYDYRPAGSVLPRGQEFVGLLRVLAHFAAAQREGKGLRDADLLASETLLTDDLLQRYLGDLHRAGIIQRGELGEWMVVRDLATSNLLDLYEEGDYRLPLTASLQGAREEQPGAELLDRLGHSVRDALDMPLSALFAADAAPLPPEPSYRAGSYADSPTAPRESPTRSPPEDAP